MRRDCIGERAHWRWSIPVVSQEVGLFWAEGEIVLPMANAFVSIVQELNKSGESAQASCRRSSRPFTTARPPRKSLELAKFAAR